MQLRVADNKELKRNSSAESEKQKEEEQEGQCMNYTFTPQSEVPALFMSKKSPHSLARIVLCLLWNAIAVHLILNDSEVSPRHPTTPCTHTHTLLRKGSFSYSSSAISCCSAVTRVKLTVAVTGASVITCLWAQFAFHDNQTQQDVSIMWGQIGDKGGLAL